MSYLLKALEKAEQERERQTHSEALPYTHTQEPSRLPMGLMVFIVLALGATLFKVFVSSSQDPVKEVPLEKTMVPMAASLPEKRDLAESESTKLKETSIEPILITPDAIPAHNSAESSVPLKEEAGNIDDASEEKILELYELPKNMLAKIPTLTLESHIYSSAAEYRSVVINGRTFKEGMMINAEVVLNSITNKGVVLDVSGQKVSLDKGITWVASSNAK